MYTDPTFKKIIPANLRKVAIHDFSRLVRSTIFYLKFTLRHEFGAWGYRKSKILHTDTNFMAYVFLDMWTWVVEVLKAQVNWPLSKINKKSYGDSYPEINCWHYNMLYKKLIEKVSLNRQKLTLRIFVNIHLVTDVILGCAIC